MTTTSAASSSGIEKKRKHDGERKHVYLGMDDFHDIVENNAAFIDKTLFIKEWMEQNTKVSAFLRPRRFGKSINLSMLQSFFSFESELKNFGGFLIRNETEFIEKHCGKYPVVFMSMQGIDGENWEDMLKEVWSRLREVMNSQARLLNKEDKKYIGIKHLDAEAKPDETIAKGFLSKLTSCLHDKFNKKVILLIDEYDAPLNHASQMGFYARASRFFHSFYSHGLKDNQALKRACLMGTVEIQGGGILSGLNNLVTYPCNKQAFSQYFGFTKEEITTFLKNDKEKIQSVMKWYNGYHIGSHQVINPWSFMSYIKSGILNSYWTKTVNIDSLHKIINSALSVDLIKVLAALYEENEHASGFEIGELSTIVNCECPFDIRLILCFLVHAGYLTYYKKKVFMPNQEIKKEWVNCSFGVTHSGIIGSPFQQDIMNALQADPFKINSLENAMRKKLQSCSFSYTNPENVYHVFYFGIFSAVCGPKATSNKEAGCGQYDIGITFEKMKRLFIFEVMHSKAENFLDNDAKDGLKQIHKMKYYENEQYYQWTCVAIGVSFYKKQMSQLAYDEFQVT